MLFLGVLSVFQVVALPGLLFIRLFPGRRTPIQQAVYIFMLSLLANHTAVLVLVALGIYLRSVVLVLFALQVALLVWLYRDQLSVRWGNFETRIKAAATDGIRSLSSRLQKDFWPSVFYVFFGLLAVTALTWVVWVWIANFDTVFQTWDAWASWDRWAEKWAENRFPGDTWEYPQLIPITYSIGYKFIGTVAVKFFGKSIMPLFLLAIGLMFFDLGLRKKSFGYMFSSALVVYMIGYLFSKYIADGYVDIPVACFSLMAIYSLLVAEEAKNAGELRTTLLLGSLATASAAVTKQTGLYIVALYPLLAFLWILRQRKDFAWKETLKLLGWHILAILVLVFPWYAYMQYRIWYGGNESNIQYVISDIYGDMTMAERFMSAMALVGPFVYLYGFAILSLPVLRKPMQHLLVMLVLPFSILWAFFLGYEVRNLAVALPPLAVVSGKALEGWLENIAGLRRKTRPLYAPLYAILLLASLVLGLVSLRYHGQSLIERQVALQKQIYEPELNRRLYSFFWQDGPQPMLTNYPTDWLPGLEGTWINELFVDYDSYQESLLRHPEVTLMLVPLPDADERIQQEIQSMLEGDTYKIIFTEAHYSLIRIPPR
ncbi:MAG: hypothetical protein KIS80_00750 [Anaerolineales bacterium]|nr:hypothetical protein [Anaerolineales bacterium]